MNAGGEERFIGVNVSQPRERFLVQERRFDRSSCVGQAGGQLAGAEFQRLWAEVGVGRGVGSEPEDAAETPGIGKAKLFAGEAQDHMGVRGHDGLRASEGQAAAHSQMDVESRGIIQVEDDLLAPAQDGDDGAAGQLRGEVDIFRADDVLANDAQGIDSAAEQVRPQTSHNCFNLGQFRHLKLRLAGCVYGLFTVVGIETTVPTKGRN